MDQKLVLRIVFNMQLHGRLIVLLDTIHRIQNEWMFNMQLYGDTTYGIKAVFWLDNMMNKTYVIDQ